MSAQGRGRRGHIEFAVVREVALGRLPELLRRWLPDGGFRGNEYVALNPRRVDRRPGSFRVNVQTGRWSDFAVPGVSGGDPISLAAYLADCRQIEAARGLAVALWGG